MEAYRLVLIGSFIAGVPTVVGSGEGRELRGREFLVGREKGKYCRL